MLSPADIWKAEREQTNRQEKISAMTKMRSSVKLSNQSTLKKKYQENRAKFVDSS